MEKKKYASNTRAKNKWNAANYDRLYPYVKKGKKATYLAAAQAAGKSLNEWIETTLDAAAQKTVEE
jgi:predicted HicB family RNase H-like nuclease